MSNELTSHAVLHIGIQQSHTHIAQSILDIRLRNLAQPTHLAEGIIELIRKEGKHA